MGGSNMLHIMGNSFFRPYAERFSELALDADFLEHQDRLVFTGYDNELPIFDCGQMKIQTLKSNKF